MDTALRLQQPKVDWCRQRATAVRARPAGILDEDQRQRVRTLAVSLKLLGSILLEHEDANCVPLFEEAIQLFRHIAARRAEADVAVDLGYAYVRVPDLRNLDQATIWCDTSLALLDSGDRVGRGRCVIRLGGISLERFADAQAFGAPAEELLGHLTAAATAYHQALELLPDDAIVDLATIHNQLGVIYRIRGALDTALVHYRAFIRNEELGGAATGPDRHGSTSPSLYGMLIGSTTRCCTPRPRFETSHRSGADATPLIAEIEQALSTGEGGEG